MTATRACERGYVASNLVAADGTRSALCSLPVKAIPAASYNRRALARDPSLPLGRESEVDKPTGTSDGFDPMPQGNTDALAGSKQTASGCAVTCVAGERASGGLVVSVLVLVGLLARRRRRFVRV